MFYEKLLQITKTRNAAEDVMRHAGIPDHMLAHIETGACPDLKTVDAIAELLGVGTTDLYPAICLPKKAYLAGPITGVPNFMSVFASWEDKLTSAGFDVINPAKITAALPKNHLQRKHFMDLGITLLSMADFTLMLPGWETHSGCNMEYYWTIAHGIPAIMADDIAHCSPAQTADRIKIAFDFHAAHGNPFSSEKDNS